MANSLGDDDAAADPFAVVTVGRFTAKTKTIKTTCFPLWYETLTLDVELPEDLETAPDVHVTVRATISAFTLSGLGLGHGWLQCSIATS